MFTGPLNSKQKKPIHCSINLVNIYFQKYKFLIQCTAFSWLVSIDYICAKTLFQIVICWYLTITTFWANSADNKFDSFLGFFPRKQVFLQIVSIRDNLHGISKPVFWDKVFQYVICWKFYRVLSIKCGASGTVVLVCNSDGEVMFFNSGVLTDYRNISHLEHYGQVNGQNPLSNQDYWPENWHFFLFLEENMGTHKKCLSEASNEYPQCMLSLKNKKNICIS